MRSTLLITAALHALSRPDSPLLQILYTTNPLLRIAHHLSKQISKARPTQFGRPASIEIPVIDGLSVGRLPEAACLSLVLCFIIGRWWLRGLGRCHCLGLNTTNARHWAQELLDEVEDMRSIFIQGANIRWLLMRNFGERVVLDMSRLHVTVV